MWALVTLLVGIISIVIFAFRVANSESWPTGSDPYCFLLGVGAFLIIVFESLLWLRKKLRLVRILGKPKTWMKAHIWLGLLCVPFAVMHSGLRFGGPLTTALMVIFGLVILSGVSGLILQQFIPKMMFQMIPHETIHSQIPRVVCHLRNDAEGLIRQLNRDFAFEKMQGDLLHLERVEHEALRSQFLIEGDDKRNRGGASNIKSISAPTIFRQTIPKDHPLVKFAKEYLDDFMSLKKYGYSPLRDSVRMQREFRKVRTELEESQVATLDQLEKICSERNELHQQYRLHLLLHFWLYVHYPLTILLLGLLGVHIYFGLYYW